MMIPASFHNLKGTINLLDKHKIGEAMRHNEG